MDPLDITQTLKDTENTLRDFISAILLQTFGVDWINKCGATPEKIGTWKERKVREAEKQEAGVVEERLLYYANFSDLRTILSKNWELFKPALGEWARFEVYFDDMVSLRNPEAHRRELLPHQKHLATGIAGEIRGRLIRFRSKMETSEDCFPRIECARDSLGNVCTDAGRGKTVRTGLILHPGDLLEFIVTASDPLGGGLEYCISNYPWPDTGWQESNNLCFKIEERHISTAFGIFLCVRSLRSYHADFKVDDRASFYYDVVPPKPNKV
jgi:hypothetical protein